MTPRQPAEPLDLTLRELRRLIPETRRREIFRSTMASAIGWLDTADLTTPEGEYARRIIAGALSGAGGVLLGDPDVDGRGAS